MFGDRERVFVSYSSKNDRFVREEVLPQIERAKREHWFAPRSIGGGDDWRMKLLDGLDTCDRLLVVVSREAQESSYVRLELANATKRLVDKCTKVDARDVHRAVLPVKIDERGPHGEKNRPGAPAPPPTDPAADAPPKNAGADKGTAGTPTPVEVDPYLIHPYLTLVNFIAIPHNDALNARLCPETGEYLGDTLSLTPEQQRSIREYRVERDEARKKLTKAILNPDCLRLGFSPLGRLRTVLKHATVQRVAIAAILLFALSGAPAAIITKITRADPVVPGTNELETLRESLVSHTTNEVERLREQVQEHGASVESHTTEVVASYSDSWHEQLVNVERLVRQYGGSHTHNQPTAWQSNVLTRIQDLRTFVENQRSDESHAWFEQVVIRLNELHEHVNRHEPSYEEPKIVVTAGAREFPPNAGSEPLQLESVPAVMHIKATANGLDSTKTITLPSPSVSPPHSDHDILITARHPDGTPADAPIFVGNDTPDVSVPGFALSGPTMLDITFGTTKKIRLVPTAALAEEPSIRVSPNPLHTVLAMPEREIHLSEFPSRIQIQATANGKETTTGVNFPPVPPARSSKLKLWLGVLHEGEQKWTGPWSQPDPLVEETTALREARRSTVNPTVEPCWSADPSHEQDRESIEVGDLLSRWRD